MYGALSKARAPERHKFPYLTLKGSNFARFASTLFQLSAWKTTV